MKTETDITAVSVLVAHCGDEDYERGTVSVNAALNAMKEFAKFYHAQFEVSDEEIDKERDKWLLLIIGKGIGRHHAWSEGAKWMRDKIFNSK